MATGTVKLDSIPYRRTKRVGSSVTISNTAGTSYNVYSDGILHLLHESGTVGYIRVYYDIPTADSSTRIFCYFIPGGSFEYRVIPVYAGCKITVLEVTGENNSIKYFPFVE